MSDRRDPRIVMTEGGFSLREPTSGAELCAVSWHSVTRIETFKLDLLTTDCICLLFEQGSAGPPVQVSEEWEGFADLFEPMHSAFPGMPRTWYEDVMTPAFESRRTVLHASDRRVDA